MQLNRLILLVLLISTQCVAEQRLSVKEGGSVTASVSEVGLNRIAVEGDRILSVKALAGQFQMDKDAKLGQIFIQPTLQDKGEPIHLFITTEKGFTYSLNLLLSDLAPESIILVPDEPTAQAAWEKSSDYETTLAQLIKAMHNGSLLKGYDIETVNKNVNHLKKTKIRHLQTYRGPNISGNILEIISENQAPITLEVKDFYHPGVRAVAILNNHLKPHQKTFVYIVK